MHEQLFLSRRNLLALLAKLDRVAEGEDSACTIIKNDYSHPVFPASIPKIAVTAVEDELYYRHREAGEVLGEDLLRSYVSERERVLVETCRAVQDCAIGARREE